MANGPDHEARERVTHLEAEVGGVRDRLEDHITRNDADHDRLYELLDRVRRGAWQRYAGLLLLLIGGMGGILWAIIDRFIPWNQF